MQETKENQDAIHRIDPESSEEISNRFEELVELLQDAPMKKFPPTSILFTTPI